MKTEIIAVGTELLLGQIVDTNSSWMGEQLALAGIDSHYQTKVGDNWDRIEDAFRLALDRSDAVIVCGGLGPTQDDITREVLASVMGVELVLDERIADRIRSMFASRHRPMPENNLRQAMVPTGATPIPQQPGTAPGLVAPIRWVRGSGVVPPGAEPPGGADVLDRVVYVVPGVPYEMREMLNGTVLGDLQRRAGVTAAIESRVLRTWGQSESGLAEMLAGRIDELDEAGNPTLAFLASGIEGIKVRITAKGADSAEAWRLIEAEQAVLEPLLGDLVFAHDDDNMETAVLAELDRLGLTLGVAETITGGRMANRLSSAEAAMRAGTAPGAAKLATPAWQPSATAPLPPRPPRVTPQAPSGGAPSSAASWPDRSTSPRTCCTPVRRRWRRWATIRRRPRRRAMRQFRPLSARKVLRRSPERPACVPAPAWAWRSPRSKTAPRRHRSIPSAPPSSPCRSRHSPHATARRRASPGSSRRDPPARRPRTPRRLQAPSRRSISCA